MAFAAINDSMVDNQLVMQLGNWHRFVQHPFLKSIG